MYGVLDGLSAHGGVVLLPPARGEYVLVLLVPAALDHLTCHVETMLLTLNHDCLHSKSYYVWNYLWTSTGASTAAQCASPGCDSSFSTVASLINLRRERRDALSWAMRRKCGYSPDIVMHIEVEKRSGLPPCFRDD